MENAVYNVAGSKLTPKQLAAYKASREKGKQRKAKLKKMRESGQATLFHQEGQKVSGTVTHSKGQ